MVPVIIPEFRMNQLLRRYCKAFRAMRSIDMNAVRPSRAKQEEEKEISRAQSADLISEEEFQSLYAQALKGGSAVGQEEPVLDLVETVEEAAAPEPAAEPVPEPVSEPILEGEVLEPEPLAEPETPPEPVPSVHREAPRRMSVLELEDTPRPRAPAPEQVYTPLTFAEAQAELSRSVDREQVATTVLRFALGKWKRCLLLSVQGSLVTGWRGMGQGCARRRCGAWALACRGRARSGWCATRARTTWGRCGGTRPRACSTSCSPGTIRRRPSSCRCWCGASWCTCCTWTMARGSSPRPTWANCSSSRRAWAARTRR
ncbi:hypothetical protein ACN28S_29530 [Cystobacter fuscus]